MAVCSLQWVCEHTAIARVHPEGSGFLGEWSWRCIVVRDGDTAVLYAAEVAPNAEQARALLVALRLAGFSQRRHERVSGANPGVVLRRL